MSDLLTIYHGSEQIIEKPAFGKGRPNNDYGRGFYCTEYPELAKEWACDESHGGYSNKYSLDISDLTVLNLNNYTILHWLAVLLKNRIFTMDTDFASAAKDYLLNNFSVDTTGYDIIEGYRADDSYFSFARDFLHNGISVRKLSHAMKLGELGNQIVIISPKAFDSINFVGYETVDQKIYFPLRHKRDILARSAYLNNRQMNVFSENDIFMIDILRGGIKADDPRIQ